MLDRINAKMCFTTPKLSTWHSKKGGLEIINELARHVRETVSLMHSDCSSQASANLGLCG